MFRMQKKPGNKWLVMPQMKVNGRWVSMAMGYVPIVDAKRIIASAQEDIEKRAKRHNNPRRRNSAVTWERQVEDIRNYSDFKRLFKKTFNRMTAYKLDQAGSRIYIERLGELADLYPEWEERLEDEIEREHRSKRTKRNTRRINPGLKVGDRVVEGSRKGKVVAFHTRGTVDVLFDDMEYPIRRQLGTVRKA